MDKSFPLHLPAHISTHVCCMCSYRSNLPLMEVYSAGNWHPVCRTCLHDIGLEEFAPFTTGKRVRHAECVGQGAML